MGADTPQDARRIAELLPAGTPVYVNHLPRRRLAHTLPALMALSEAGLEPVPHVAVRRIASRAEARNLPAPRRSPRRGCAKVLLIGGDIPEPVGPYAASRRRSCARISLSTAVSRRSGSPAIPKAIRASPPARSTSALADKLGLARKLGLGAYVVTQFSFAPNRIVEYCADLARRAPDVPVYVGLAGPTSPRTLLRFAQRCGVSASLRALQAQGMGAVRLFTHVDPSDQLIALARHARSGSASNVVGVHLYSFGGVAATATWMNARITARCG